LIAADQVQHGKLKKAAINFIVKWVYKLYILSVTDLN
jgi:hypothetical protein